MRIIFIRLQVSLLLCCCYYHVYSESRVGIDLGQADAGSDATL